MSNNSPLELFTAGYITALLWSSVVSDSTGDVLNADEFELSTAGADRCRADCHAFYQANQADVDAAAAVEGYSYEHAGHDFALTRNGHGAGYWDGDLPPALGERLTASAENVGPCEAYIGGDLLIYFEV